MAKEITAQSAMQILKNTRIVKAGLEKNVYISNISRINGKTNQPFLWEETGEPYAIVNFRAMNQYGATQALVDFKAGNYAESVNHGLSARVSYELADKLAKGMPADIVLEHVVLKDNSEAELVRSVAPATANTARVFGAVDTKTEPATTGSNKTDEQFGG